MLKISLSFFISNIEHRITLYRVVSRRNGVTNNNNIYRATSPPGLRGITNVSESNYIADERGGI